MPENISSKREGCWAQILQDESSSRLMAVKSIWMDYEAVHRMKMGRW
jgi:hypothetical protein